MPFLSHAIRRTLRATEDFDFRFTGKWFYLSAVIGVIAGLAAIAFFWMGAVIQHFFLSRFSGWSAKAAAGEHVPFPVAEGPLDPLNLILVLAAGGLASGVLVHWLAPETAGAGTDAAIDAFHNKRGEFGLRTPLVKTLASAITLGTGGSAGREGPIAQIGAGVGSVLATRLGLSTRDRRILLAAGMGAGVGAIFRAPLAGALFAGEILYRDAELESDAVVPAAISSTIAYSVFCLSLPPELRFAPLFGRDVAFSVGTPLELIPFTALAFVLVLCGVLYIRVFHGTAAAFQRLPTLPHFRPMIGALLAGLAGVALYLAFGENPHALAVLGSGYGTLQDVFGKLTSISIPMLLAIALVKVVTTSLTVGSGGSGGVFGPSMVIGGCLGAAVGRVFNSWFPALVTQPEAFAIVGMAGFFAGCARAPFSTILMVTEMTGDYKLLVPTLWVSSLCFLLGRPWTLYQKQVFTRLDSPAHRGDFIVDVLEGMQVRDVYQSNRRWITVDQGASLDEIVHLLAKTTQRYFPVVDESGGMIGIFASEDVRAYLYDDTIWNIANARDVMNSRVVTLVPEDDLNVALTWFTALNVDELPVVDPANRTRLIGVLRRKETIAAYHRRRLEHIRSVDA